MPTSAVDLIERGPDLARVRACVDAARDGHGMVLAVEGEAGIGKSALFEAGVRAAQHAGLTVLTARASALERGFPFGVVRQALERTIATREDLLVGQAGLARGVLAPAAETVEASTGTLHGLYWLLASLADEQPVILAIDDLHWADEESLAFLRFLTVRTPGMRLTVLLATRPPPGEGAVAELLADPVVELCVPAALSREGTIALLANRLDATPEPEFAEACRSVTGGNPFLLHQLTGAMQRERLAPTAQGVRRVSELQPEGLARALIGRLGAHARATARALAILGDEVESILVAELAELELDEVEEGADALAAAGLVADARPLRFRHALLRGAVLADMRAGEQARMRGRAVDILRARDSPAERVAAQLLAMDPRGEADDAAALRVAAADALARGAPASAVVLLERALREGLASEDRAGVLVELGGAELTVGAASALDHLLEAAALATDPGLRMEATLLAGRAAPMNASRLDDALVALDALPVPDDRDGAVRLLNAKLAAAWTDMSRWHVVARGAASLGFVAGDTPDECRLMAHLARAALESGRTAAEVRELLDRALRQPLLDQNDFLVPTLAGLLAVDRIDDADELAQRAATRATERGELFPFHIMHTWQGRVALMRGDLARAEERSRAAIAIVPPGPSTWWSLMPVACLTEVLVDQGRTDEISALWAASGIVQEPPAHRALNVLLHARACWRRAAGDPAAALEDLREIVRRVGPAADTINWVATRLRMAEALHALGSRDEAVATAVATVELARRFGAAGHLGRALRVQGRLRDDESLLAEAVDVLSAAPARLEYARALIDRGAALRRRGERRSARVPLREGYDLALVCGALPDAERARAEMAASGVHVERLPAARRDDLTPSERRIAGMAADRMSNKEIAQALFLTVKTVEMHLSATYRKLDVRSRRDLAARLGR